MYRWLTLIGRPKNVSCVPAEASLTRDQALVLGRQLADLREAKGLTQEELAHRVGISRNHLQLLEMGLSDRAKQTPANPRLSTLVALCRQLDATVKIDADWPDGFSIEINVRH